MTVRSIAASLLRGARTGARNQQAVTKEAVVDLIQNAASKDRGLRKGWQVKAASWIKKVHIDRGDVKVGFMSGGRFQVLPHLRPRYFVPADLDKFDLKPYVEIEGPRKAADPEAGSQP
ncbi:hypothetical protein Vretimale_10351 [Volvox reticuliferus]|uniref:Uncharacterized protein n=1 Tax=Volvox reticuliferus TaxID=1737510 RepID=A0A8J4GF91_9CHLO|nr:hypothetical protein Vretifemale_12319 [Volvox reticuliferus]GIM05932.1 hypothetical protein Vretimale_10351 [Volvox reticuliferus]